MNHSPSLRTTEEEYPLDAMLDLLFKGNNSRLREGGRVMATWRTTEEADEALFLETPKNSMTLVMGDLHQMRPCS